MSRKLSDSEIAALKAAFSRIEFGEEGGVSYVLLPGVKLPEGCEPSTVDLLLALDPRDGYQSRLFYSARVSGTIASQQNWNTDAVVFQRRWFAFSWKIDQTMPAFELLMAHLQGLRRKT